MLSEIKSDHEVRSEGYLRRLRRNKDFARRVSLKFGGTVYVVPVADGVDVRFAASADCVLAAYAGGKEIPLENVGAA